MKQKILIIDDEKMLTDLLARQFSENGYIVHTANGGEQALELLNEKPDLILLDINMPDIDGLSFCKTVRKIVTCPIIFLTARITEQDKLKGFQMGGDDYITKPFSLAELTARVDAHLRREERRYMTPQIITCHGLIINLSERTVSYQEEIIPFTKLEFDIIELLLTNSNQIFDKERIYELVWGLEAGGDNNVVKEHIRKIRTKLNKAVDWDFIKTVWGIGYKWER